MGVVLQVVRLALRIRAQRGGRKDDDYWRDLQLQSLGWKVCRFWVYELRENLQGCTQKVVALLSA